MYGKRSHIGLHARAPCSEPAEGKDARRNAQPEDGRGVREGEASGVTGCDREGGAQEEDERAEDASSEKRGVAPCERERRCECQPMPRPARPPRRTAERLDDDDLLAPPGVAAAPEATPLRAREREGSRVEPVGGDEENARRQGRYDAQRPLGEQPEHQWHGEEEEKPEESVAHRAVLSPTPGRRKPAASAVSLAPSVGMRHERRAERVSLPRSDTPLLTRVGTPPVWFPVGAGALRAPLRAPIADSRDPACRVPCTLKSRRRAKRDSLPRSERGFKGVRRSTPLLTQEAGFTLAKRAGVQGGATQHPLAHLTNRYPRPTTVSTWWRAAPSFRRSRRMWASMLRVSTSLS